MLKDWSKLLIALTVLLIAIVVISGLFLTNPFEEPETQIDLSRSSVIKEIESLGRLETASYSIEKIIEAGRDGNFFQDVLYGDRILLIAHGKIIAGVDLTQITENDVTIQETSLSIRLPAPEIFSSNLDNTKTTVYDRTQGLLSQGDKDLESETRRAAEDTIRQAACEAGILTEARENATEQVTQLFEFAGFEEVTVTVPEGKC